MQAGRWIRFLVLSAMITVLVSCDTASRPGAPTEARGAQATPGGLRAAYVAAVQARASEVSRVERAATGLSAANPAQDFTASFTRAGLQIAPVKAEGSSWSTAPARWGCEGDLSTVEGAEPEASGNRVEYRRGSFVEWYVNGPLG